MPNEYIPQIGDVVFINHKDNFISKLFSGVMGSKWSHTAIVYGELNGGAFLLETNDYCVCPNFLDRYFEDKNCVVEILRRPTDLTSEEKSKITTQGKPLIGNLYGYFQLISLSLRILFKRKFRNFIRQGLVCCHVIGYCYKGIDSPLNEMDPESFDTEELYKILLSSGFKSVYKKEVI